MSCFCKQLPPSEGAERRSRRGGRPKLDGGCDGGAASEERWRQTAIKARGRNKRDDGGGRGGGRRQSNSISSSARLQTDHLQRERRVLGAQRGKRVHVAVVDRVEEKERKDAGGGIDGHMMRAHFSSPSRRRLEEALGYSNRNPIDKD